jgi:hypothetical protein
MARSPFTKRPARSSSVLLVAVGAVAGIALGMLLADRVGGIDGLLRRGTRGGRRQAGHDGWRADEGRTDPFDELADDDSELAPEAIAHLHVRHHSEDTAAPAARRSLTAEQRRDRMRDRRTRSAEPEGTPLTAAGHARAAQQAAAPAREVLEERVLEVFRHDPILEARAIDIGAVGDGVIELTGWVESTAEIAHALTLARGVPGVTAVVDCLAVSGPGAKRDHRSPQYETPRH